MQPEKHLLKQNLQNVPGEHFDINYAQNQLIFYRVIGCSTKDKILTNGGVVIGRDGKVVFVRHGSIYVRVSSNRIIKAWKEFQVEDESEERSKASIHPASVPSCNHDESDDENKQDETNDNEANSTEAPKEPTINQSVNERIEEPENGEKLEEQTQPTFPKPKDKIMFKQASENEWTKGEVLGRAGKSTGKFKSWINVKSGETSSSIDLNEMQLKFDTEATEEVRLATIIPATRHGEAEVIAAKKKELQLWKDFSVYDKVPMNCQKAISTTWVITEKQNNNDRFIKARLVA